MNMFLFSFVISIESILKGSSMRGYTYILWSKTRYNCPKGSEYDHDI